MAEELITDIIDPTESILDEVLDETETSAYQPLIDRLEKLKALPTKTSQLKKEMWSQFLVLWCEILQIPPSDAQSCYVKCAHALPRLINASNFLFIRKDVNIARNSCFSCITQLNHPNMRYFLQLTTEQQDLPANKIYYKHIYYLLRIATQTVSFLPFSTVEDRQFIEKHADLYRLLIEKIEESMPDHCQTVEEKNHSLGIIISRVLGLLWNTADRTVLIPILLRCDLAKKSVGWLAQASKLTANSRRPLISIIHNIARHDDGVDELNKYGAIEIIKQYQKTKIEKNDAPILITSMVLALLSTPEELKRDQQGMNIVLNQLLQLVINAAKGDRYRRDGFHVSEPLCVLVKMFVVEERTLDFILCHAETRPPLDTHSKIRVFASLLFKFADALNGTDLLEQFTLTALLNIFWSISFQQSYSAELIQDQEFIAAIRRFVEDDQENEVLEQYKPRSMEGVKEAAHGILHNLNLDSKHELVLNRENISADDFISDAIERKSAKPSIMISYCHADNPFCSQVYDLLCKHSDAFDIWIDRTHCQGVEDLWESIADGMEQASIIVCLLSGQYFESKSCRKEFIYATDSLKKKILPVLIEQFEPKGWLGIRMTGIKYVRFRGSFELEQNKITELVNTVLSSLSSTKVLVNENLSTQPPISHATLLPLHESSISTNTITAQLTSLDALRPVDQWTSTSGDIHMWFAYNQLSTQFRDLFNFQTGEEMLNYAQMLVKDREKHMNTYARIFAQKYNGADMPPHEFNRFATASEKLLRDNRPSSVKTNKSNICTIL
ncbi:unnamed protein product [Rotaria magnacalcarata]|uniref:TIR domain-containing protein n=1 Tax=Rotaria magnacalcarata TaxID=392030 RepID=A0A816GHV8_9BILA|nr:unnamed protein product [Rotaria magnacalcarata]CAF1923199.1 unnamed protein product [Rotaria magnacalcarata]CAF4080419.1 unnamed protein product [Rotaria magnacalcarata]